MRHGSDRGPLIYVAGRGATLLLAPLSVVVLPALLGEAGYGRYGYWFGLISVYMILFDLGTQPMLRRFLPELAPRRQSRGLFMRALWLKLIPLALMLAAVPFQDQPAVTVTLLSAGLLAALATNLSDVAYAYQRMGWQVVAVIGRRVLRLLLVPLLFLGFGVPGILAALVLAELLAVLLALPAMRLLREDHVELGAPFLDYYAQGLWVFGAALIAVLLGRLPVFAAQWSDVAPEAVGRIALAVDLTYFALKELLSGVSESLLPRLVTHQAAGQDQRWRELVGLNYRLINLAGLGILTLGLGLGGAFLGLLGHGFYRAEPAFALLLPAVLFGGWNLIHNQLLLLHRRSDQILQNQAAGLLTALTLIALVWPVLPIETLALASTAGVTVACGLSYLQSRRSVPDAGALAGFLRLLPVAALVGGALTAWAPRGLRQTALAAALGGLVYLGGALAVRALRAEDLTLLRRAAFGEAR